MPCGAGLDFTSAAIISMRLSPSGDVSSHSGASDGVPDSSSKYYSAKALRENATEQ
jgi:hypothetical protein